ncbi:MAG TPA: hypothetical protein VI997_03050, partial [Candidatus Thermoplasmatota archaeon]|nr:hypothetical protein [Candidatus Thermoplasmatota archaeon]
AEGRQSLAVKRFDAAGALLSTRVLGEVNMTDGASMSARRVAWSGGHTLFFHHLAASEAGALVPLTTYLYDFEAAYAEPSVDRDTVAYVKSTLCTSGATCNSVDFDPPQFSEVRLRKFTTDGTPDALPTFTDVAIGTAATSSFSQTTQTCDGLTVPRTRTATFVSQPFVHHAMEMVRITRTVADQPTCTAPETRTTTEGLVYFERTTGPGNNPGTVAGPSDWSGREPFQLGRPAASNRYVFLLDYASGEPTLKAYPWVHCYETNPGAGTPSPTQGPPTKRCLGASLMAPSQ